MTDDTVIYDGHVKLVHRKYLGRNWDVVVSPDAAAVLYIDPHDDVYFVKQFRPAVNKEVLELPAETLDKPGKSSLQVIVEGLHEECGIKISEDQVQYVMTLYSTEGHDSEKVDLFIARGPSAFVGQKLESDERITVLKIPFERAYAMIASGELQGSKTVALLQYEFIRRLRGAQ